MQADCVSLLSRYTELRTRHTRPLVWFTTRSIVRYYCCLNKFDNDYTIASFHARRRLSLSVCTMSPSTWHIFCYIVNLIDSWYFTFLNFCNTIVHLLSNMCPFIGQNECRHSQVLKTIAMLLNSILVKCQHFSQNYHEPNFIDQLHFNYDWLLVTVS